MFCESQDVLALGCFFFSSRRRHTRYWRDWSSDVCSSDLIAGAEVFDPFGDGEPENVDDIPLTYDGDPASAWSTLTYRGSPAFGNLKPGVGILYDLGQAQQLSGVTVASPVPGATVEIRTGDAAAQELEDVAAAADGTLGGSTDLTFAEPVTARYGLRWVTGLLEPGAGFPAEVGEISTRPAGARGAAGGGVNRGLRPFLSGVAPPENATSETPPPPGPAVTTTQVD